MRNEIKVVDVTQLNSGSPTFTVIKIDSGFAICVWFDDGKEMVKEYPLEANYTRTYV